MVSNPDCERKRGALRRDRLTQRKIIKKQDQALYDRLLVDCAVIAANEDEAKANAQERYNAVIDARNKESEASKTKLKQISGCIAIVTAILLCRAQGEGIWYWIGFAIVVVTINFGVINSIMRYEAEN